MSPDYPSRSVDLSEDITVDLTLLTDKSEPPPDPVYIDMDAAAIRQAALEWSFKDRGKIDLEHVRQLEAYLRDG